MSKDNFGQQVDPRKGKRGYQAASVSVPSAFEKQHKLLMSIAPNEDISFTIRPDGSVKMTVNGVLFNTDGAWGSLDQRILYCFKKAFNELEMN